MTIASVLTRQLEVAAPVYGVSIGNITNKLTWRIDFKPEATPAQRRAAQDVVKNFDIAAEEQKLDSVKSARKAAKERVRKLPVDALLTRKDLEDAGLLD